MNFRKADYMMNQLAIRESSNTIKYESFGVLSNKKTIWTPEINKSIYLTSVQGSGLLDMI